MMSDIPRFLEIQELAKKAGAELEYKSPGRFILTVDGHESETKTIISSIDIDTVYGAAVGYLFAKENV